MGSTDVVGTPIASTDPVTNDGLLYYSEFTASLSQILDDDQAGTYPESMRTDALNSALTAISQKFARAASEEVTVDANNQIELPEGYHDESPVYLYDATNRQFLRPSSFETTHGHYAVFESMSANEMFYEFPRGVLSFVSDQVGSVYTLYYWKYWDLIAGPGDPTFDDEGTEIDQWLTYTDELIDVPRWMQEALLMYAASYCAHKAAANTAKLGVYKQKPDLGNPEHNPHIDMIKNYERRYELILSKYGTQDKMPPFGVKHGTNF